ncbi:hypothetical protein RB195_021818 [Necator americanus]|uniref:NADP-dependent oxidoreductase domain-containing protein n=1 Tax=Necator americanus TaxID=51031 RepID=A0ABR1ED19_NECAM
MSDVSNSFSAWETLPEDESPLPIAVRRPVLPPRHYEALWVTHLHPDDTEAALRKSLSLLRVDYVDLYLAHMPTCFNHEMTEQNHSVTVVDVWRGLEGVYRKGLTRSIGVSNFNKKQIKRIMKSASVPIHNLQNTEKFRGLAGREEERDGICIASMTWNHSQASDKDEIELHLYFPQHGLQKTCEKYNISLTSYASLGSPGRISLFLATNKRMVRAKSKSSLEDQNVKKLAEKYQKTPAQILLRYIMDRNIAVIPRSLEPSRIVENFQVLDFKLEAADFKLLDSTRHRQRLFFQDFMKGHPEDPWPSERKH